MPKRPDFYCDFYCAAWDGLREPGTPRYGRGSRRLRRGSPEASLRDVARGARSVVPRPSGSWGVESQTQRLIPVGRPGIDGLRVCETSPIGSLRRGR